MLSNITPIRPAPQFSPEQLAAIAGAAGAMVNAGLEILNAIGGDPDVELNGDEEDGTRAEDDSCDHDCGGPGCPVSDPDYGAEEAGEGEEF